MAIEVTATVGTFSTAEERVSLRTGVAVTLAAREGDAKATGSWLKDNQPTTEENPFTLTLGDDGTQLGEYRFDGGAEQGASNVIKLERATARVTATINRGVGTEDITGNAATVNPGDIVELTAMLKVTPPVPPRGAWFRDEEPIPNADTTSLRIAVTATGAELGSYVFKDESGLTSTPFELQQPVLTVKVSAMIDGLPAGGDVGQLKPATSAILSATYEQLPAVLPKGQWYKDDQPLPGPVRTPTWTVTMSASGGEAGAYWFKPDAGSDSNRFNVEASDAGSSSLGSSSLWIPVGIIVGIVALALASAWLLNGTIFGWSFKPSWFDKTNEESREIRSWIFAVAVLSVFLLFVQLAGRASEAGRGISALFVGADLRASTSKVQAVVWTILVGFALAFIAAYTSTGSGEFECPKGTSHPQNCVPPESWPTYLILLGVPLAAAVAAKGVVSYKVENNIVQKTEAQGATVADLTNNDAGNPDLVDVQYLLFNLIAFGYVCAVFFKDHTLPEIPDVLLGLTSAAAGTYVFN